MSPTKPHDPAPDGATRIEHLVHRPSGDPSPPHTAFVLAGGGSRGAVQVGMLAELVDRGIRAERVYGASVGAVNGAAYCGDPTPTGMEYLEEIWRSLSGDTIFPRGRTEGPWTFFQQRRSVHANTGLRRLLESGLRFERLEDAAVPFEVVATSLTDGRERWLTRGRAIEAVLASAAIPALFPPVRIGSDLLVDGGVVDNVPISRAIAAGATRVYVLLCGPLHYKPRPARRPVEAVLTTYFVAVHARFARELALVPPDVEVVVFSGGGDPAAAYRDFSGTSELITAGRDEVARVLDGAAQPRHRGARAGRKEQVEPAKEAGQTERAGQAGQAEQAGRTGRTGRARREQPGERAPAAPGASRRTGRVRRVTSLRSARS